MTVGLMANAFSGVPTSIEMTLGGMQGVYPLGRGTEPRSPFIFTANLYAEYSFQVGRTYLTLNLNIDNVTDNGAARRVYPKYNQDDPALTTEDILAHYDYKAIVDDLDPRFLKKYLFLDPIRARVGVKFGF